MYYFSRVQLDWDNQRKMINLWNLGAFHNYVEQSFPKEIKKGIRTRHLWRIDRLQGKEYLLLISEDKPDLNLLCKYGVNGTAQTKEYDSFLEKIEKNQFFYFRLTANPVYKATKKGQSEGKVYPHVTVEQQRKWLLDRSEKNGFKILAEKHFDIVSRNWPILYKKKNHWVRFSRVSYEGMLQVIDETKLRSALVKGIGKEKAYGMGLLTIIPYNN